jgi:predicted dehydrogenase
MTRLKMAVIGVGHLGRHHARILAGMSDVELVGVVDANSEHAIKIADSLNTTAYDRLSRRRCIIFKSRRIFCGPGCR